MTHFSIEQQQQKGLRQGVCSDSEDVTTYEGCSQYPGMDEGQVKGPRTSTKVS